MYLCRAAITGYDDVDSSRITILVQGEYCFFFLLVIAYAKTWAFLYNIYYCIPFAPLLL